MSKTIVLAKSLNKTQRGKSTKDGILDVALKIASQVGIEGLTIGELAKEVGMSKSGLFAHFNSRDNLQLMILERAAELFKNKVLLPAFRQPRGEPRLMALFENWIRYLNDEALPGGSIFVSAAFELDDRPGPLRDYVQNVQKELISGLKKTAEMCKTEGHFSKSLDAGHFAWTMYSFVLGYHHSKRMIEDPQAESHLRAAFEGLIQTAKNLPNKTEKKRA